MITGPQFRAKISAVLAKVTATSRVVQLRQVSRSGGNDRLGVNGTVTVTLTAVDPQPAVSLVSQEELAKSGSLAMPGDYRFIFDGNMPEATLRQSQILFGDEVLNIVQIEPYAFQSIVVGWSVIGRTVTTRT